MMSSACQPAAAPSDSRSSAAGGFPFGLRHSRAASHFLGNAEPPLDELMGDPMVRRLMDRDGVEMDSLLTLIDTVRDRLR